MSTAKGHQPISLADPATTKARTTNISARAGPTPLTVATSRSRSSSVGHIHVYSPTGALSAREADFGTKNEVFAGISWACAPSTAWTSVQAGASRGARRKYSIWGLTSSPFYARVYGNPTQQVFSGGETRKVGEEPCTDLRAC